MALLVRHRAPLREMLALVRDLLWENLREEGMVKWQVEMHRFSACRSLPNSDNSGLRDYMDRVGRTYVLKSTASNTWDGRSVALLSLSYNLLLIHRTGRTFFAYLYRYRR